MNGFSPAPKPAIVQRVRRQVRPKKKPAKVRAAAFERKYGSLDRVEWVKAQPCAGCGIVGYSENAHTEVGGTGFKANAETIAPLCGPHMDDGDMVAGCHRLLHRVGKKKFETVFGVDLAVVASRIASAWLALTNPSED